MFPDAHLDLTPAAREALGKAALQWVLQAFDTAREGPLYPSIGAADLQALVAEPLPQEPQDPATVLAQFAALATLGRNNGHPRMFGYVQSSATFAGVIGDFLASALNQNVTSWRSAPSATTVERQVIEWIGTFVGYGPSGGVLLSGGSAANGAALQIALAASSAIDVNARGVAALPGAPRVYASDRVHMSVPKAAAALGLGRDAVRLLPTGRDGRMDVGALRQALDADRAAGHHAICVVANAGEVNTGAIDPLDEIADVCAAHRLWMHVDGAYGGCAAAVPRLASAFAGMTRADSVALDPHKWLFAPLDAGCLLVRNPASMARAFSHGAAYIDVVADRDMSDFAFWDVSPELSRRFRALKIWFALKCHGAAAYVAAIDRNVDLAQQLAAAIDASPDFERLAPVPLGIVCFRHVPSAISGGEPAIDAFNRELMVELQRAGSSYLSNAVCDGRFALRACIVNHRTRASDLGRLLDDLRASAARLLAR